MKKLLNQQNKSTLLLAKLCRRLPVGLLPFMSILVGEFMFLTRGGRRREIKRAYQKLLSLAGSSKDPGAVTRKHFRVQLFQMVAHYVLMHKSDAAWNRLIDVEGEEHLTQVLDEGRGAILSTLHFGSHLLMLAHVQRIGRPAVVVRPESMKAHESQAARELLFLHNETLYVGQSAGLASPVRHAVRHLKGGQIVAIAPDGDQGGGETAVQLLGRDVPLRVGALEMARLAEAPLIYSLCWIEGGRMKLRYHASERVRKGEQSDEALAAHVTAMLAQYERALLDFPECAHWTRTLLAAAR